MLIYVDFVLFATLFMVSTACIAKVIYVATQPGQIFGGWQKVLNRLNEANSRVANALFKPLGGCEFCFAHLLSVISYLLFSIFILYTLPHWPLSFTDNSWINVGTNVVGYLMYVCTCTVMALLAITRI